MNAVLWKFARPIPALLACAALLTPIGPLLAAAPAPGIPEESARKLDATIRDALAEHGDGVVAGVWVGGASGGAWYAWEPDTSRPSASAIKTSFLIELFARYADALDEPPAGLDDILRDEHPAIAHFAPAQREEIRNGLKGASVRKIGGIMMGSVAASNIVYNGAASVATALLGGPPGMTKAIRDRDPGFASLTVRRYMLARRDVTGDNEASPAGLAAVMQRLASGKIAGVDPQTTDALRRAILEKGERFGLAGSHHFKDGLLDSNPLTFVHCGWWEPPKGEPIVYAVMVAQPDPAGHPRGQASARLGALAGRIASAVLGAATTAE